MNKNYIKEALLNAFQNSAKSKALIHAISNHITQIELAQAIVSTKSSPIMADEPKESGEISSISNAILLNLGQINEKRKNAMINSLKIAKAENIPYIIDIVGYGISKFRKEVSRELLNIKLPDVLKGNISEIKSFFSYHSSPVGVDAGKNEIFNKEKDGEFLLSLSEYSTKNNVTIVISGKKDLIVKDKSLFIVSGGSDKMPLITGTGCMLGALTSSYLPYTEPKYSALIGALTMAYCGKEADEKNKYGLNSYKNHLLDELSMMNIDKLSRAVDSYLEVDKIKE